MKRLAFLVAGTAAALVVSAGPAFADNINSPHQKTSAASGETATTWGGVARCAGCHRAHTAQGAYLLKTDQEALCLTCHAGTGSALDVENGVSTSNGAALRGGGFLKSALDASHPSATYGITSRGVGLIEGKIPALIDPVATTSSHGMGVSGAWGYGLSGSTAALSSPLECGSCHDPHGNGNYRLLNTVPGGVSNTPMTVTAFAVATNVATVTTSVQHYLGVGNTVTISGMGAPFDGTFPVLATPSYTTFTYKVTAADGAVTVPAAAKATNAGQAVLDAPSSAARVYTTADYWKVNDETTPTITVGSTTGINSFIGSIAEWCTQCHTRYQTGPSGTYKNATDDAVFTYRHRGNAVKVANAGYYNQVNAANCIQCHVAHGTNATAVPTSLGVVFPGTTTPEDSSLLRISNRGVCQMCHNK